MAGHHIQPYAFEPTREVISEENNDSESSDESQEMGSDNDDMRDGNVSWCTCKECRVSLLNEKVYAVKRWESLIKN